MVWSPPIASRCAAPVSRPAAAASIWSTASLMSNGLHAMSPASATCWTPNGATCRPGCQGRRSREPCRTAAGPNRAPGRYDVPLSNGTPTTATSQELTSSRRGSRANVGGPAKRGVLLASIGPRMGAGSPVAPGWPASLSVTGRSISRPGDVAQQSRPQTTALALVFSTVSLSAVPRTGVITVEDLLRSPALQLRLIAGEAGVSRRVAWAHVSELEDPTPWLSGAELIMTTGMALARGDG